MPKISFICWDILEIYFIYTQCYWYIPDIYLRYAIPEICQIYTWDIPEIDLRYTWDIHEIYLTYTRQIPVIYLIYSWYISETSWAGSATLEIQVSESRVEYIQQEKSIWSDGWVDDSFRKYCHFMAPSWKLELARFSA